MRYCTESSLCLRASPGSLLNVMVTFSSPPLAADDEDEFDDGFLGNMTQQELHDKQVSLVRTLHIPCFGSSLQASSSVARSSVASNPAAINLCVLIPALCGVNSARHCNSFWKGAKRRLCHWLRCSTFCRSCDSTLSSTVRAPGPCLCHVATRTRLAPDRELLSICV